jgi:L-lactate dehydrogenase complex protein LldG
MNGRDTILGAVRRSLKRKPEDEAARSAIQARLDKRARGPIPARANLPRKGQVDLFQLMAEEHAASVTRIASGDEVPGAIASYLKAHNLPQSLRCAPDPALEALPWDRAPMLKRAPGRAEASDEVSLTGAFAGVAETGTLMLHSGESHPTTLNFLPDTHIVVLKASQVVGSYEDAWDRVRAKYGAGTLPRTVNFVTGPSRTADIEQTIQLGAHGPRRLHIVLVEDQPGDNPGTKGGNGP